MVKRRQVAGNAYVDRARANTTEFTANFQNRLTRYAWGEIWTRPRFDERTRRILVIGTLMALDKWEEFLMHIRAALGEGSFTPDDANTAYRLASEAVRERTTEK
jgi:alkylhydroperoxidase/carboxymuconolactone decarboxylase family protein YurZ